MLKVTEPQELSLCQLFRRSRHRRFSLKRQHPLPPGTTTLASQSLDTDVQRPFYSVATVVLLPSIRNMGRERWIKNALHIGRYQATVVGIAKTSRHWWRSWHHDNYQSSTFSSNASSKVVNLLRPGDSHISLNLGPFLSLAWSKLRLCSANHRAGYFSNLACDWLSIVWAYSEQETENGPWSHEGQLGKNFALKTQSCTGLDVPKRWLYGFSFKILKLLIN